MALIGNRRLRCSLSLDIARDMAAPRPLRLQKIRSATEAPVQQVGVRKTMTRHRESGGMTGQGRKTTRIQGEALGAVLPLPRVAADGAFSAQDQLDTENKEMKWVAWQMKCMGLGEKKVHFPCTRCFVGLLYSLAFPWFGEGRKIGCA